MFKDVSVQYIPTIMLSSVVCIQSHDAIHFFDILRKSSLLLGVKGNDYYSITHSLLLDVKVNEYYNITHRIVYDLAHDLAQFILSFGKSDAEHLQDLLPWI